MANGGLRGIQVTTNTVHDISTSYYFNNDQTTATTAIQYAWNPPASPSHQWVPPVRDGTVQTLLGIDTPTPGYAAPGQVPAGLVATPAENDAPVITDLTGGSELPETDDIVLGFDVTDDRSEEHTSELQSLMRISYAVFCLKKKKKNKTTNNTPSNVPTQNR